MRTTTKLTLGNTEDRQLKEKIESVIIANEHSAVGNCTLEQQNLITYVHQLCHTAFDLGRTQGRKELDYNDT